MQKPKYKILRNLPSSQKFGQYVYSYNVDQFWFETGLNSPFKYDDLYTIIIKDMNTFSEDDSNPENDIYFPSHGMWGDLASQLFSHHQIGRGWRAISNVFVGNPIDLNNGTFVQRYYDFDDNRYLLSSTPNVVNLYFDLTEYNDSFDVKLESYWSLLSKWYNQNFGSNVSPDDLKELADYDDNYRFIAQPLRIKIFNWDWKPGDLEWDSYSYLSPSEMTSKFYESDNITPKVIQHQYDEPGLKIIKAMVYSEIINDNYRYVHYQKIDIRINLSLDDVYFEDFTILGGPDFTYIPWPHTTPIIGGISEYSKYLYTLERLLDLNKFSEEEKYQQYIAQKAYQNTELGKSLGDCDLQQIRCLKYNFDMNYLLGLSDKVTTDGYDFTPYYDNGEDNYWNGEIEDEVNRKFDETSVGDIFIDESMDIPLKTNSIFEINVIEKDEETGVLLDTSGNGNLGILIGDYKITKNGKDTPAVRESVMKLPLIKEKPEDGAI